MSITGLDKIADRIRNDANAEAARILAEAEEASARIRADYEARAEEIRKTLSNETERMAMELINRTKASAETQKRNRILACKSETMDRVFEDTYEQIRSLKGEKYISLLVGLLAACLLEQWEAERVSRTLYGEEDAQEPDAYEVILNMKDRDRYGSALIEGVRKKLAGKAQKEKLERIVLANTTASIDAGLVLRCGSIEINSSLAPLFSQLRRELEAEVGQALFTPKKQT